MSLFLALIVAASAGEPQMSGRYTLAESPEAVARTHDQAVQEALQQLTWAFRPFARPRLTPAVTSCSEIELALTERTFRERCDAKKPLTVDRSAPAPIAGEDGKTYEVRLTVDESSVGLRFGGEEGGQATTYALQPDGTLVVTKSIFSPYLAKAVAWSARYRKAD